MLAQSEAQKAFKKRYAYSFGGSLMIWEYSLFFRTSVK